jgi:hypothetical protein
LDTHLLTNAVVAAEMLPPEALTADGFEDALIGLASVWTEAGQLEVAAYDFRLMVDILIERDGMSSDEAIEYLNFNTIGAYVGPYTPVYLHRF